jgi:hypothetical protein
VTDSPKSTNTSENSQPDQWAALQWEPWVKTEGAWEPPSNDLWVDPLLVTIRAAFAFMFVPKDRLVELWRDDADMILPR